MPPEEKCPHFREYKETAIYFYNGVCLKYKDNLPVLCGGDKNSCDYEKGLSPEEEKMTKPLSRRSSSPEEALKDLRTKAFE